MPKSGKSIDRLLPADHAVGAESSRISTTRSSFSRTAVSISWLFIMKPPSPHTAITRRFGIKQRRHHRRGQSRAHGGERVVEQQRVGDMGAVVAREPDLVHAVVEADDAVLRHDLADVVHEALRRHGKRSSSARSLMRARMSLRSVEHAQASGRACPRAGRRARRRLAPMSPITSASGWKTCSTLAEMIADMDDLRAAGACPSGTAASRPCRGRWR